MHRVVRLVVTLLLALGLPLQAVSATTMTLCAAGHARVDSHAHASPSAHDGRHGTQTAVAQQAESKSAACEACCSAGAVPPSVLSLAGTDLGDAFARTDAIGAAAFLTAAPERPPRPFLA